MPLRNAGTGWDSLLLHGKKVAGASWYARLRRNSESCSGFDAEAWLQTTLKTLKRHTDREIWVRAKKGNTTPLDADLKDCHAVVAHSSNAAVVALLAGVPVFCTAPCAAYRMGEADMSKIEMPVYPDDREQWAWNLADQSMDAGGDVVRACAGECCKRRSSVPIK